LTQIAKVNNIIPHLGKTNAGITQLGISTAIFDSWGLACHLHMYWPVLESVNWSWN